jgi:hypothetical protein
MTGSVILDVAIGMTFIYLTCSVLCSTVVEFISGKLNWRSDQLEEGVRKLLADDSPEGSAMSKIAEDVLGHSLIAQLAPHEDAKPSYIPSRTFALALFDTIKRPAATAAPAKAPLIGSSDALPASAAPEPANSPASLIGIRDSIAQLPSGPLRTSLGVLVQDAAGDVDQVRENVERWFDNSMVRLSGAYKRRVQWWNFLIAASICILLNVDTVSLVNAIGSDPGVRSAIVTTAAARAKVSDVSGRAPADAASIKDVADQLSVLREEASASRFPLGWDSVFQTKPYSRPDWYVWGAMKAIGLLFSIFAVSLGAPFWFDLLNKLVNLRSTGPKPKTQQEAKDSAAAQPIAAPQKGPS